MNEEFHIGQIFEGMYPKEASDWANENNVDIVEIDPIDKEIEETYIEMVEVEKEVVIPAVTHEEIIPAEYDDDGNVIKEEETVVVVDEPEHTEIQVVEEPQEKTRTVVVTVRRFEIQEKPAPTPPTHEEVRRMRARAYQAETDPIQTHIDRLKDKEQTPEIIEEIEALRIERDEKMDAIKARYPYPEEE